MHTFVFIFMNIVRSELMLAKTVEEEIVVDVDKFYCDPEVYIYTY
jgi:hypothetical protein